MQFKKAGLTVALLVAFFSLFQNCSETEFTRIENSNVDGLGGIDNPIHTGNYMEAFTVEGKTVLLSVEENQIKDLGSDTSELSFQWYKLNKSLLEKVEGQKSLQLNFVSAKISDSGEYILMSKVAGLDKEVARALVDVSPKLELVSSDLVSQTIEAGKNKDFKIVVRGPKKLKVRWNIQAENSRMASPIRGKDKIRQAQKKDRTQSDSLLSLKSLKVMDTGYYSFVVFSGSHPGNKQELRVGPEKINVLEAVDLRASIRGESNLQINSRLNLQVVLNRPSSQVKYQWYLNNKEIAGATASSYQVASANFSHEGNYTVRLTSSADSSTVGPHRLNIRCASDSVRYQNTCKLKRIACTKDGHPGLSYFNVNLGKYQECQITKCRGSLVLNNNRCACPSSMPVQYGNYQCHSSCGSNEVFNATAVRCECRRGTELVNGRCLNTCAANQERVNGRCVSKCVDIQTRNSAGQCMCPSNTELVGGRCLRSCGVRQVRNSNNMCVCNSSSELYNGQCVSRCRSGQERVNGQCVAQCRNTEVRNSAGQCTCPSGQRWLSQENRCMAPRNPVLRWTSAPSSVSARGNVRFSFEARDAYNRNRGLRSLSCSVDGRAVSCSQGNPVQTNLSLVRNFRTTGSHSLRIEAVDIYGARSVITHNVNVSCTNAQMNRNGACLFKPTLGWDRPVWLVKNNTAITFSFATYDPDRLVQRYECRMTQTRNAESYNEEQEGRLGRAPISRDFGWQPCTSGYRFTNPLSRLGTGPHVTYVRGLDANGKVISHVVRNGEYRKRGISYPRRVVLWAPNCTAWTQVNINGSLRSQCYKCRSGYKIQLNPVACIR